MQRGLAAWQATGAERSLPQSLSFAAEVYRKMQRAAEGIAIVEAALALVQKNDERYAEAELYRLKGELILQSQAGLGQVKTGQDTSKAPDPRHPTPDPHGEAEECFLKAIEVAKKQHAKSLELRATVSLARLRQQQAAQAESRITDHASRTKLAEAHRILSNIYNWFTEGFDTKDLQEAKALLAALP
jgi:predicted ATPase